MKYIVLICSLYLLAIAVFPCNDVSANEGTTSSAKLSNSEQEHRTDASDFCSPFCTCACCNVSLNLNHHLATIEAPKPALLPMEKIAFGDFNFISDYFGNIWQPPKINA